MKNSKKCRERLTKWSKLGTLHIFGFNGEEISLSDISTLDVDNLAFRLAELEDKIEQGRLIEVDNTLIGKKVIGIQKWSDGTYAVDDDINIVIGFDNNGVVVWNDTHLYNDWFKNGFFFLDNEKGKFEAEEKVAKLNNE